MLDRTIAAERASENACAVEIEMNAYYDSLAAERLETMDQDFSRSDDPTASPSPSLLQSFRRHQTVTRIRRLMPRR